MTSQLPIGTMPRSTLTHDRRVRRSGRDRLDTDEAGCDEGPVSGHPAEIIRGLSKGEEITAIDVGASSGYAFELEGKVAPRVDGPSFPS